MKLNWIFTAALSLAFSQAVAQNEVNGGQQATAGLSGYSKLLDPNDVAGKYANTIREKDLEAHLAFLSSDLLEGRETCERGQKLAAAYIASVFKRLDLKPVVPDGEGKSWFQSFGMMKYTLRSAVASFSDKTQFEFAKGFLSFDKADLAGSLDLPLAYAGYGIAADTYNNFTGLDLKGKAVVMLEGEPVVNGVYTLTGTKEPGDWSDRRSKVEAAEKAGASAVLFIMNQARFNGWVNGGFVKHFLEGPAYKMEAEVLAGGAPVFYISEEMAGELLKTWKVTLDELKSAANGSAKVKEMNSGKLRFKMKGDVLAEKVSGENVLGFIEGTDLAEEIVVLTAHYDHIGVRDGVVYNGADDDGTGTAAVLEMAEAFSKAAAEGHRPRRSILFMPVAGEEKGLLGSEYYTDHPVFPLDKTVVDLNIDMIGRLDKKHEEANNPFYVYIIGSDKLSSQLHEVNEAANTAYTKLELDYTFNSPDDPNQFYYRSDHYNFAKNNIPVIFYFSGVHEDYHQPGDDIEKIHFGKTMRTTKLVFLTAWEIANRDQRLPVDRSSDFENED